MKYLKTIFGLIIILILFSRCQTIKKKSDEVAERENEKFGLFVGKQVNEMKLELGAPTEDLIIKVASAGLIRVSPKKEILEIDIKEDFKDIAKKLQVKYYL